MAAPSRRVTVLDLAAAKRERRRLTMVTAYDWTSARLVDAAGIDCVLVGVDAPAMPPVAANVSRIPARLEPGQHASFTCPFRAADPEVALRSELHFRSTYDLPGELPGLGRVRLTNDSGPFVLDAKLLPPRWTAKPGKD